MSGTMLVLRQLEKPWLNSENQNREGQDTMFESILIVLIGIGLVLFIGGWAIGHHLGAKKALDLFKVAEADLTQEIRELSEALATHKGARQAEIQVHCQAKDAASAEIKFVKDKLTQLDDAWLKKTGHLFKFGAEDFQKKPMSEAEFDAAAKIVDTKIATGDIDQVIIEAPEGSTVKLKKDK